MNIYLPMKILIILYLFLFSLITNAQNEILKDSISNNLSEVIIRQDKKAFTNNHGNIKVDVANSIYNSITNTVDLLSRLPTVQISSDKENISIVGKGNPLIYIDNQKVNMNDLNVLAVADIKTIEIIQNPSAKYEAEGRSVILITRKFSKKDSFQTEISEVASFKKKYNNYLGFNSVFKKNKLEFKANFNYNRLNPWESHRIDYQIPIADIASKYDVMALTKRKQFILGTGLFYKINGEDYFSFNVNSKLQDDTFPISTITNNRNKTVENDVVTYSENEGKKNFINSFLNYSQKINPIEAQVFTGLQFSNLNQAGRSLVWDSFNETQPELSQNRNQNFKVNVFSGRIDLEKKFKNDLKFEAGGVYLSAHSKSDIHIFDSLNNENEISYYNFKEQNLSGYSQFSGKVKKMDFSVGVRIENTNVNGKFQSDILPLIDKNYTNFFPKAQFSIAIDSVKSMSFNYAKSIQRPNYSSLSQGTTYINPYFLYGRNINLDPTITSEISTSFQYHDHSVKLSYYQNTNPVYNSFMYDENHHIMTFQEINLDKESGFNLDFELPFRYKFWTINNSVIFVLEKTEDASAVFLTSKPYVYYYSNNEFKFPKGYTFVLDWWGATKQNKGIFERNDNFIMNVSVSKKIRNWNLALNCNDIFKSTIYKEQFTINHVSSKAKYWVDACEISIAIKYSFGKIKETEFKEKRINETENRIR